MDITSSDDRSDETLNRDSEEAETLIRPPEPVETIRLETEKIETVEARPAADGRAHEGAAARDSGLEAGKPFGAYRLLRLLGQGGFGQVWEAESLETGRRLALKILTEAVKDSFYSIINPERGLQGLIIGTHLVPR